MKTSDFNFYLPENLIAQEPVKKRGQSRLMILDRRSGSRSHGTVLQLPQILCGESFLSPRGEKPLLVFNDTKVMKARLIGKSLGSQSEAEFLLLERTKKEEEGNNERENWKVMAKRVKRKKDGSIFVFYDNYGNEIARAAAARDKEGGLILEFDRRLSEEFLDRYGQVPLPPYIKRAVAPADAERYQTIYARHAGSAAAPTAGLHFSQEILSALEDNGIQRAFVTLHVGLGTFLPVRSGEIKDHVMHEERFIITEENAALIEEAAAAERKIVAVGTTSLRALESAACFRGKAFGLKRGLQSTSIFIYPGYKFKIADALFTNFHTPASTLLMLVCAFAGRDFIFESYAQAIKEEYRFFSYGDAMLIS